ncbi:MAG: hypothetical protein Q8P35_00135 [Candidatus Yanofskybacteria bacterium]|nr:hypothetical protein [Candidatus Yanofskybacteria bacterium]
MSEVDDLLEFFGDTFFAIFQDFSLGQLVILKYCCEEGNIEPLQYLPLPEKQRDRMMLKELIKDRDGREAIYILVHLAIAPKINKKEDNEPKS